MMIMMLIMGFTIDGLSLLMMIAMMTDVWGDSGWMGDGSRMDVYPYASFMLMLILKCLFTMLADYAKKKTVTIPPACGRGIGN